MDVSNDGGSTHAELTFELTAEGLLALAAHDLAHARKTRSEQRRKSLCERVIDLLESDLLLSSLSRSRGPVPGFNGFAPSPRSISATRARASPSTRPAASHCCL